MACGRPNLPDSQRLDRMTPPLGVPSLATATIRQMQSLTCRCRRPEEWITAAALACMLHEIDLATTPSERQAAIMNAVSLLEKLVHQQRPWYARREKLLAFLLSLATLISVALPKVLGR